MDEKVRLQKFLSQQGICSRRAGEAMIRAQRLTINGQLATLGDRVSLEDLIRLDGNLLEFQKKIKEVVLAFYKPKGVECTWESSVENLTLSDYDFKQRVFNVGRLDKDSHGLLLLTNNGELANKLMHPKYQKEKEYLVVTSKEFDDVFLKKMAQGVEIAPNKKTKKCLIERVEPTIFRIILTEGRNRQIRRMCEKLGYKVIDLLRIRVGKIFLGDLKEGRFRYLSEVERKGLSRGGREFVNSRL